MSTLARHVSYLEKALLLAIKHPNDFGIGADAALATAKHQILFDIAMRDIRTSSRQNFSDISLLVNFAGMLVRFFEVAVVQDKLGAENGVPLPLTIAAFGLADIFSNILFTISKSGKVSAQTALFKQVCTLPSTQK